jgi:AraC-like DNA-binding protein
LFWRDPALPFLEIRTVQDGRKVCYARHSHAHFSIGAITGGISSYLNEQRRHEVTGGAVVLMNPGEVHACNPLANQPWSYHMLYVNTCWLADVQYEIGLNANRDFHCFHPRLSLDGGLYRGLLQLVSVCQDKTVATLGRQEAAQAFFVDLQRHVQPASREETGPHQRLQLLVDYLHAHCTDDITLSDLCAASALSASYLIRAFRQRYHMTPHAFLLNCRIQHSQQLLRRGQPIAQVAQELGFADQAHFQRTFKRLVAATPGQYSRSSS